MIELLKGNIKDHKNSEILKSFGRLPLDQYLSYSNVNFRSRRYSKSTFLRNRFIDTNNSNFFQKNKNNRFVGGLNRKFQNIEPKILNFFKKIVVDNFSNLLKKKTEIGFHQIRISCGKNFVGYPVPEGWHRDGFNYVAIINFKSKNIEGGITRVRNNIIQNSDNYSCFLQNGDYICVNDEKFYHYTDPINILNDKLKGFRDNLVVTFKYL